jgi:S-adenosylmethionine:tRNA ribosyltransferase-isomerase
MDLAALDYPLDPSLIAQRPPTVRDAGRLLVVTRGAGVRSHALVRDLPEWLHAGDLLIVNDAEVIPARLRGHRATGGAVEVLLTEPLDDGGTWRCLARRARRLRSGENLRFAPDLEGTLEDGDGPLRAIRLRADGDLASVLRTRGEIPLPPYIRRVADADDGVRYQTIFARSPGAVAAPTAGLHFTPALLADLAARDVAVAPLTLLVGPATFLPVRDDRGGHRVPAERYHIPTDTAAAIARRRASGRRVVAVGTTTVRALESAAGADGAVAAGTGATTLTIAPGHRFRVVDALFTNLHLPRSTLLALVAAFAGVEPTLAAYRVASRAAYRFYSYGDAMLIQ